MSEKITKEDTAPVFREYVWILRHDLETIAGIFKTKPTAGPNQIIEKVELFG